MRLRAGLLAARATGAVTRLAGRGGTSLPGKVLMRAEPQAIARLAARLPQGSVVVSATNGKTTTAAMVAAILRRTGTEARAQPRRARTWRAASPPRWRPGAATSACSRSTSSGSGRSPTQLEPRAVLLGNLFRDQLDRYGELEIIADRWAAIVAGLPAATGLVLNADDPLVADLGRHRDDALYFGVQDDALALPELQHASDSKHCRRCGHAYIYEAAYLAHLGRYECPNCGAAPARSRRVGVRRASCAASARPTFTLTRPQGTRRIELPLPGLYNVYNALGAAALCLRLGVPLDEIAAGPGRRRAGVRPRRDDRARAGAPPSILLVKNPAGANEVLRTLALEATQLDLFGVLNDRTADGRDVSWVWDADWEIDRAARAAADLLGHARGRAGAAAEVRGRRRGAARRSSTTSSAGLDTRAGGRQRPAVRAADLHRAARAQGPARAPRPARGVLAVSAIVWHDIECGAYTADLPLWEELAAAAPGPVLDVGAGTGRVALHLARAGFAVTALDVDAVLLAELERPRPRRRRARRHDRGRRRGLRRRRRVRPRGGADADDPAAAATAAGFFALARGGRWSPAASSRWRSPTELEAFEGRRLAAGPGRRHASDGTRFVSQPTAVRGDRRARRGSSACATRSARTARAAPSTT